MRYDLESPVVGHAHERGQKPGKVVDDGADEKAGANLSQQRRLADALGKLADEPAQREKHEQHEENLEQSLSPLPAPGKSATGRALNF